MSNFLHNTKLLLTFSILTSVQSYMMYDEIITMFIEWCSAYSFLNFLQFSKVLGLGYEYLFLRIN